MFGVRLYSIFKDGLKPGIRMSQNSQSSVFGQEPSENIVLKNPDEKKNEKRSAYLDLKMLW